MHLANGQDQWKRGKYCRDHQTQKRDRTLLGPNQTSLTNTTKTQAQIMNGPKIVNPIGVQNECDTYTKMQCKSSFGKKKKKRNINYWCNSGQVVYGMAILELISGYNWVKLRGGRSLGLLKAVPQLAMVGHLYGSQVRAHQIRFRLLWWEEGTGE